MQEYDIDFEMFDVLEIVKIIEFFHLIETTAFKKVNKDLLISKYNEYRKILNNKSLEKKYDKMLYNKSKVSIYKVMKSLE
ncbi:MAG: UPF0223 family protein [Bacilli bacterium]|nr:UPF0223 family protein [Bacilli bacterium]